MWDRGGRLLFMLPFTARSRRHPWLGAASIPKLESPAEFFSLRFLLITLVKWDSAPPLKVRVCEQTLSNWWYKMSNCLTSVFSTTQIEIVGGNWFTEGDTCHLKLGQVKPLSSSLKDRLDLSASAARRTHGSTGLNLWAPDGALSNLLPIGKCCYYNGKR